MVQLEFIFNGREIIKYIDINDFINDIRGLSSYIGTFALYGEEYWFYIDWKKQEINIHIINEHYIVKEIIETFLLKFY